MGDYDGPKSDRAPMQRDRRLRSGEWWLSHQREEDPADIVNGILETMDQRQSARIARYRRIARAYGIEEQLFGMSTSTIIPLDGLPSRHAPTNVLSNIIDSLQADVYKSKLIPMPVTDRGSWRQQRRGRDFGDFLDGVCQENKFDQLQILLGLHVLLFGTAVIKGVETMSDRVGLEVVPRWELWVDDLEARYGKPRSQFHRYLMDRGVAMAMFAGEEGPGFVGPASERARMVDDAGVVRQSWFDDTWLSHADMITVTEAYRPPSGPKAKDGRCCICLVGSAGKNGGSTVADYGWTSENAPFRYLTANTPIAGIDGVSAAWRLLPNHDELFTLDERIRDAHAQMSVPRIFVMTGSGLSKEHIDDVAGAILEGTQPPVAINFQPIHPDVYAFRDSVKREMYEVAGTSGMQTNAQLPAGMKDASGVALAAYDDQHSARHAVESTMLEGFIVQVAWLIYECAERLSEREGDYVVHTVNGKKLRTLKWSDVKLDREAFKLKVFAASGLSRLPSARFSQLEKMLDKGIIDVQQFRRVWGTSLDIDAQGDLDSADLDVVLDTLDKIAEDGVYLSPEPFDDLELAMKWGRKFYNLYRLCDDADPAVMMLLQQFIDEAEALSTARTQPVTGQPIGPDGQPMPLDPNAPPPPPMGGPPGMPPMGDPMMGGMPPGVAA